MHKVLCLCLILELVLLCFYLFICVPNTFNTQISTLQINRPKRFVAYGYLFNCANIDKIKIIAKLGHGRSKQSFSGESMGQQVAVKTEFQTKELLKGKQDRHRLQKTYSDSIMQQLFIHSKVMKEVRLSQRLNYKGLATLLGYCRNSNITSGQLNYSGPVSVYELGKPLNIFRFWSKNVLSKNELFNLPWEKRLKYSIQLADLLDYIENSPERPFALTDSKPKNFATINDNIILVDINSMVARTITCKEYNRQLSSHLYEHVREEHRCQVDKPPSNINAKFNMISMNWKYFNLLLSPKAFPENLVSVVERITRALNNVELSAFNLKNNLSLLQ